MPFDSCRRSLIALAIAAVSVIASLAAAGKPVINSNRAQLALRGYDAVAYFTENKAVAGSSMFEFRWMNATWRFVNAQNRDRFSHEPERYAPQFGGYCAYAVSQGHLADGDPNLWRIVDGHLFLNYSADAQRLWLRDVPGNIANGNRNWPAVLSK